MTCAAIRRLAPDGIENWVGSLRMGRCRAVNQLTLALVLAAYATVYAITPQPLAWHLDTSCERILAHVVPSVFLAVALRLSPPRHCAS